MRAWGKIQEIIAAQVDVKVVQKLVADELARKKEIRTAVRNEEGGAQ